MENDIKTLLEGLLMMQKDIYINATSSRLLSKNIIAKQSSASIANTIDEKAVEKAKKKFDDYLNENKSDDLEDLLVFITKMNKLIYITTDTAEELLYRGLCDLSTKVTAENVRQKAKEKSFDRVNKIVDSIIERLGDNDGKK